PFCDEVAALLSAADLVVSRAGAGTLAELIRCQAPALLIPYPQAADNHQQANAAWLVGEGGARWLDQSRLPDLSREVRAALADDGWQESCRAQLQRLDRVDPLMVLLDDLENLVSGAAPAAAPSLTT